MTYDFLKSKWFQWSLSFAVGLIAGYLFGVSDPGLRTLTILLDHFSRPLLLVLNFTPSRDFLSDVAAFEAVVIGLAIPLSFEIVSRISERYKSEVITKRFIQEWSIQWLQGLLIFNIVLAVAMKFFVHDNPTADTWKVFAWIAFGGFLFTIVVLLLFLSRLKRYATDIKFVLNELFDEAEELLK